MDLSQLRASEIRAMALPSLARRRSAVVSQVPAEKQRDLCIQCNRSRATCFCGFVKPFDTRTRFVLLMHPKEYKHQKTGTGRLTKLSLRNSEIIMGDDFTEDRRLAKLLNDESLYPVVLFPGRGSVNLSEGHPLTVPEGKTLLIFVIDGTWRLARKVMRLSSNLQTLPRICFTPANLSRFRIKKQPAKHCVSTIEAAYYLLDILEARGFERLQGRHASLIEALDSLVTFQVEHPGYPGEHPRRGFGHQTAAHATALTPPPAA
jgi:DTW domain-containing protein